MLKWTILISGFLFFYATQIFGQQEAAQIKWHPTGKFAKLGLNYFQTVSADDQSVTYQKVEAGLRLKASDIFIASHSFDPVKSFNLMPEAKPSKSGTSQLSVLSVRNGKMLAIDAIAGFAKGLIQNKMFFKILDENFSAISEPSPLKQSENSYLPVNLVDLSNLFSNRPFQLIENEDGVFMAYLSSNEVEGNLHIGLAKFDLNFNLVFNQLYEIGLPANRVIDFRLGNRDIDGSYFVLIKETLEKKPATKIQMSVSNSLSGGSRLVTNEEKPGINWIYKLDDTGNHISYLLDGERPTPAFRILEKGSVLLAGLSNDGAQGRYTGAYSISLDSDLKEIIRAAQPFSDAYSNELESIKSKEKGIVLKIRHLQIHELGENVVLNIELFGSRMERVVSGNRTTYNYYLLVGDNLLFQMDTSGGFTGLFSAISKDQLEFGGEQFYSGSIVYVKDDVLHILFNDRKDNLENVGKKNRWDHTDYRKGDSVVRQITVDNNLKKLSDGAMSSGDRSVVMIVPYAHFTNEKLVLFGTDFDQYFGAVVN